jgi:quercetin dioxygenase-like cupin family protein
VGALVMDSGTNETVSLLGGLYRYCIVGAETDDRYSLFEVTGPSGFSSPFHVHAQEREAFYVVDGAVTLFVGAEDSYRPAGSVVVVPAGTEHTFRFDLPDTKLLLLVDPGNHGHEALFRDLADAGPGPDFGQLAEIAMRHGTKITGAPPAPSSASPGENP